MSQSTTTPATDRTWNSLQIVGGIAALLAAMGFRRNMGAEYVLLRNLGVFRSGPTIESFSASDWLALFQSDPLVGLTMFGVFDLMNYVLVALIYLGLYAALRQVNRGAMLIAAAFGVAGMAIYLASNQAFAMLALSVRQATTRSDLPTSMILAAAEALLAIHNPGAVFPGAGVTAGLLLVTVAGLIIAVVMLRSNVFGKATAVFGILAHGFMLVYFLTWTLPPAVRAIPPSLSGLFLFVWYILIGIKLLTVGRRS